MGRPRDLDREARAWTRLSEEVNTYTATVDDYTNDLCSRDYLAEVASRASDGLRGRIEHQLAAVDETFRASTVEDTDERLKGYFRIQPDDVGGGTDDRRQAHSRTTSPSLTEHPVMAPRAAVPIGRGVSALADHSSRYLEVRKGSRRHAAVPRERSIEPRLVLRPD